MKRAILVFALALALKGEGRGDVISYIRFEDNGGGIASDETGLLDGELINFSDTSPGGGDVSGRGWSASVPSATVPITGEDNTTSIRMNGGSAYIDLSNANTLTLGSAFTVEFYMNPDPIVVSSVAYAFSDGAGHGIGFQLADLSGSLVYLYGFDNGTEDLVFFEPAPEVVFGEWQHVAIVKEPGLSTIYLDGTMVAQNTFTVNTDPYSLPGNVILGTRTIGNESGGAWRGYIDEFRISDEALTPDQFLIVPEPNAIMLMGLGLAGIYITRVRRRN